MSQYELIALDMDGTLLNNKKEITPLTVEALKKAAKAGKSIALSTGRCRPELTEYTKLVPEIRYLICTSGALVYDLHEKKEIYKHSLEPSLVKRLLEFAIQESAMMHLLDRESIVQRDQYEHMERYGMGVYKPMYARVVTAWDDLYASYCAAPFPVEKVNFYHTGLESRERSKRRIQEAGLDVMLVNAESASLEISAAGVDKGKGLLKLCEYLGLSPEKTIAVGDADNDVAILKTAGLSVAMGNALPQIRELSDVSVADCNHDGCAEAIEKYLLA
ncbi:MAG TPA: HAD family phosphatase [Candidatus Merdisoma merdipullorum]|nr:HAD family phosphatase [Candidatus Merdisoma merdipullorum]